MKIVTAAIIYENCKILLARRAPNQSLAGMWEFPGGKLEQEESLQECLERELLEELDLKIKANNVITSAIYKYPHGEFEIVGLEAKILAGSPTLKVHDKLEWVPLEEILSYELLPADVVIAQFIIQFYTK